MRVRGRLNNPDPDPNLDPNPNPNARRVLTPVDSVRWLAAFGFGDARRVRVAAFGFGEARRFRVGVGVWCKPDAEGISQKPTS